MPRAYRGTDPLLRRRRVHSSPVTSSASCVTRRTSPSTSTTCGPWPSAPRPRAARAPCCSAPESTTSRTASSAPSTRCR